MNTIRPLGPNQENPLEKRPTTFKTENSFIKRIFASATNAFSTLAQSIHGPKPIPELTEKELLQSAINKWLKTQENSVRNSLRTRFIKCFNSGSKSLNLSELSLKEAPPASLLRLLPQLETLNLSLIKLTTINLTELTNLKDLDLSYNQLPTIDLTTLTNLENFNLRKNQLSTVGLTTLTNLKKLDLSFNQLNEVNITTLTKLETLNLVKTQLSTVDLTTHINLRELNLSNNDLKSIDLTTLINLEIVDLSYTKLSTVDLSSLIKLKILRLQHNQLNTVHLTSPDFKIIFLYDNNLTSITLPGIPNLSIFDISNNPRLSNLPLTLSNCSELTYINSTGTQIPNSITDFILIGCQAARRFEAASKLNPKIQLWKKSSGLDIDLSFINDFTNEEKTILYEWLKRLEKSLDFRTNQRELTKVVCNILKNLTSENGGFKELAFSQMAANNENCDDRASMALNELYLSWALLCENSNFSDKEQLEMIAKAGKTLALRQAIAIQLAGRFDINESVETYLYYEIRLAEHLGLHTCIKNMHYPYSAKELDIQNLIDYVEANYLKKAAEIPILEKMMEKDEEASNMIEKICSDYADQIILLTESKPKGVSEDSPEMLEWKIRNAELMTAREDAIRDIRAAWLEKHL